jgi:hypothetical protein
MDHATLATPPRGMDLWMKRVNQKIHDEKAAQAEQAEQTAKKRKVVADPISVSLVLTASQKRLCVLRTNAGLAFSYWHSPFFQKLPDKVRSDKLAEFMEIHLLPYLRTEDAFAQKICWFAFSFDLTNPDAFIHKMSCTPQKLFEFICD